MTDSDTTTQEPITVKVSAQNPRTPRQAAPTASKTVPAGPALLAGANALTIAGATLFAAAGPVGLAAGVAGVAATGAATLLTKTARAEKARRVAERGGGGAKAGPGRTGTSAGGKTGAAPRGTGAARSGGLLGTKAGRHTAAGTGATGRGLLGGKPGGAGGKTGGGGGKSNGGSKPGKLSRSLRNRQAKAARALAAATDGVRRAVRGNTTAAASGDKGGKGGKKRTPLLSRPGWGVPHTVKKARKAWRKWRRKPVGKQTKPNAATTSTPADPSKPKTVGTQVRGTTASVATKPAPAPDPVASSSTSTPNSSPTTAGGATMSTTPIQRMQACADEILNIAQKMDSHSAMEIIKWYGQWPQVLDTLDKAWRAMHSKAAERYSFHAPILDLIESVARNQTATTKAAEVIAPTATRLHRDDIADLYDAKKSMWDQSANREHI